MQGTLSPNLSDASLITRVQVTGLGAYHPQADLGPLALSLRVSLGKAHPNQQ